MPKNVLFCYARLPSFTNAVRDYVRAFGTYSEHHIHYYDMDSGPLDLELVPFDCIVFNYCFWARCLSVAPAVRERVARFTGLKIAILQDEYDYFLWHVATVSALGIDTIVTCVPEVHWRDVYRGKAFDKVEFVNALTGYVPDNLLQLPKPKPLADRTWAVGYRSRPVPFVYGRLTQEKLLIGQRMKQICAERGVSANIEVTEESRIYGDAWPLFIGDCRTMLGTESGSNVFDFDGSLKPAVQAYLRAQPDADFETVYQRFLAGHDGKIQMNQVSPRIFETIAMQTGLVLFEGAYSGVVRPWEHFIPLKKDFSNVDQVLAAVADVDGVEAMTRRAYEAVIAPGKYHFRHFVQRLDAHISAKGPVGKGYEPYYGLVGWRTGADVPIQELAGQSLRLPTDHPLRHLDHVPDHFFWVRFDRAAFHRALMRRYEAILYSGAGRRLKAGLQKNAAVYAVLRKLVRLLTGRW